MNWYLAKLVYRIERRADESRTQFDEQLRLVQAQDAETALYRAEAIGKQEEDCMEQVQQDEIRWHFINVAEMYRISEWIDGAELYSQIRDSDQPDHYIANIDRKAALLRERSVSQLLNLL